MNKLIDENLYLLKLFEVELEKSENFIKNKIFLFKINEIKKTIPKKLLIVEQKIRFINHHYEKSFTVTSKHIEDLKYIENNKNKFLSNKIKSNQPTFFYTEISHPSLQEIYHNLEEFGYIKIDDSYEYLLNLSVNLLINSDTLEQLEREKIFWNNFLEYEMINDFKNVKVIQIFKDKFENLFNIVKSRGERLGDNLLLSISLRKLEKAFKDNESTEKNYQEYLNSMRIIDNLKIELLIGIIEEI